MGSLITKQHIMKRKETNYVGALSLTVSLLFAGVSFSQDYTVETDSPEDLINNEIVLSEAEAEAAVVAGTCSCVATVERDGVIYIINISKVATLPGNTITNLRDCDAAADPCSGTCSWTKTPPGGSPEDHAGRCLNWVSSEVILEAGVIGGEIPKEGLSPILGEIDYAVSIDAEKISFYPNPATNTIRVKSANAITTSIYAVTGELLMQTNDKEIDVSHLKAGTYIVNMTDGTTISREQLIVQ